MAKKEGKKGRKVGRNRVKCQWYFNSGRREANKRRRAEKRARWLKKRQAKRNSTT